MRAHRAQTHNEATFLMPRFPQAHICTNGVWMGFFSAIIYSVITVSPATRSTNSSAPSDQATSMYISPRMASMVVLMMCRIEGNGLWFWVCGSFVSIKKKGQARISLERIPTKHHPNLPIYHAYSTYSRASVIWRVINILLFNCENLSCFLLGAVDAQGGCFMTSPFYLLPH